MKKLLIVCVFIGTLTGCTQGKEAQGTLWEYSDISTNDLKQIVLFSNGDMQAFNVEGQYSLFNEAEITPFLEGKWKVHAFNMFFHYDDQLNWIKYDREKQELTLDDLTYKLKGKIQSEQDRKT